jgi:HEAT repeat protein
VLSHPHEARAVLTRVAESGRGPVRTWAAYLAEKVLPRDERIEFLSPLASDPSSDVREAAIAGIGDASPEAAREFLPQLRKWLASDERREFAIQQLVSLRDNTSIASLRRIAVHAGVLPGVQRRARLAALVLEGHGDEVLRTIAEHTDHNGRNQLGGIALAIGTVEAAEALRSAASESPDEDCRRSYAHAFKKLQEKEQARK